MNDQCSIIFGLDHRRAIRPVDRAEQEPERARDAREPGMISWARGAAQKPAKPGDRGPA